MAKYSKICNKKVCLLIFVIISFFIVYLIKIISHNKQERISYIKNYDFNNNETNYIYLDTNLKYAKYKILANENEKLRRKINKLNTDQIVSNPFYFSTDRLTVVIVIQVHNRTLYLAQVIISLQKVLGITKAFLIFSHDYFSKEINELIQHVTYAPHMQIFYPYSMQLYPFVYPGSDEKFCNKDWKCGPAHGERNETLAQVKHHWWWKVNYVFNNIDILRPYKGIFLFLEDDQYVTEDLIYALKLLEGLMVHDCPECYMISVGAERPQLAQYHSTKTVTTKEELNNTPYNMGIAFNRTVWNTIKNYSRDFCHFNDYSWAASLMNLGTKLPNGKMFMYSILGPRVFHIGRCGLQNSETDCGIQNKVRVLKKFFKLIRRGMFPRNYEYHSSRYPKRKIVGRGNFSDIRDHELCMYFGTRANLDG